MMARLEFGRLNLSLRVKLIQTVYILFNRCDDSFQVTNMIKRHCYLRSLSL